jgi:hypothetical protein
MRIFPPYTSHLHISLYRAKKVSLQNVTSQNITSYTTSPHKTSPVTKRHQFCQIFLYKIVKTLYKFCVDFLSVGLLSSWRNHFRQFMTATKPGLFLVKREQCFCKMWAISTTVSTEVEFTNFLGSRVYLGFLKAWLESRFQEVAIHQFRAKNTTRVAFFTLSRVFQ